MKKFIIIAILLLALIGAGAAYWYFLLRVPAVPLENTNNSNNSGGYVPFNRNFNSSTSTQNKNGTSTTSTSQSNTTPSYVAPVLRQISSSPVGGYGASTTKDTTVIRYVDRGRGNVYEAYGNTKDVVTLSNTLVPRIYESTWNKTLTVFAGQYLSESDDTVTTVFASILKNASTTDKNQVSSVSQTPFRLKGKLISGTIVALVSSPKKDRVLMVNRENNHAIGYTIKFDGTSQTQVFDLPFSQINVEWPEDNTIAISTKPSAHDNGYLYFVNIKTGKVTQILNDIPGLSTRVNKDASKVFYSSSQNSGNTFASYIYDVKTKKTTNITFRALADSCVWSSKFVEDLYCGVPRDIPQATYPDDWYTGRVQFSDNLWILDAKNNTSHKMVDLLNQGNSIIDTYNMQLDSNDDYIFFVNKNDLSLWSLDLISSH